jgi:uncharacterized membrane protein YkvA (DUF1232 family)
MRPPSLAETAIVERLSGPATPEEISALRRGVGQHLDDLRQAARRDELLPVDLAAELARKLDLLLVGIQALPLDAQALVVGVARYFVSEEDAIPDQSGVLGLDDDLAVFNAAVRRIGRPELEIDE